MAVVRSLFGRFSRDASSDLKVADNIVCLSDHDRVVDNPVEDFVLHGPHDTSDLPEKFTLGIEPVDAPRQTLGELMTASREKSGLTREQVAEQTHIPAYYVRMIESDSYDAIPDQLYLLPFFRRYAIFLGLDEQKVVSRFIRDFEKSENEIVETKAPRSKASNRKPPNLKLWRQVATAVVIVGLLLTFLARGIAMMRATLNHPADSSSPVVVSSNALPPSTVLPQDSPRLVNKAPQPVDDTPNVSTDTQRPLNDAPHPLNDPPHVLNDAPPPVAALQPAETAPDATPSPAITTASDAPQTKHHRRHMHDATPPVDAAPHPATDTSSLANDAPHPDDAWHQVDDATRLSTAAPQPVAAAASATPHTKHHRRHAHTRRLTHNAKHSKPTT